MTKRQGIINKIDRMNLIKELIYFKDMILNNKQKLYRMELLILIRIQKVRRKLKIKLNKKRNNPL